MQGPTVRPERLTENKDISAVDTPHGAARVHVKRTRNAIATLVLGHGAGGGVSAPDLLAARDAALSQRLTVVLVEQPYRVAGRRTPAPAAQLDAAWLAVISELRKKRLVRQRLIVGGRSLGARVACRTAGQCGANAVLCLAFPLRPPRRSGPVQDRLPELEQVTVPTLVVQGERDPFGMPPEGPSRTVVQVAGDHSLRRDLAAVRVAIGDWLAPLLA